MNISEIRNRVLDAENLIETAIMQMEGIEKLCGTTHQRTAITAQMAISELKTAKTLVSTITHKFEKENESK